VDNKPVDNKAFHAQLFRQRSTGRAPFLDSVVILCTLRVYWAEVSYPQTVASLALISFIKKL
jgi:hypothetical protein